MQCSQVAQQEDQLKTLRSNFPFNLRLLDARDAELAALDTQLPAEEAKVASLKRAVACLQDALSRAETGAHIRSLHPCLGSQAVRAANLYCTESSQGKNIGMYASSHFVQKTPVEPAVYLPAWSLRFRSGEGSITLAHKELVREIALTSVAVMV